ncbi:hypothetical protein BMS3Bbin11_01797 [bacterium BMS3Bbin11]|nr:hypothetical protein BMS3Abin11_02366 [bacterium BMS3Abin11]GBE46696.1 hypothetical protein BMS3Bbin11_01797 [bacterium BMS3Bbin11]GMT40016.1 MAG: hypothetical protein IEMM0001_0751 [bacterium]
MKSNQALQPTPASLAASELGRYVIQEKYEPYSI